MTKSGSRFSRPLVFVLAGTILLGGGSGAAAVFLGSEGLLGGSPDPNLVLECSVVAKARIERPGGPWWRYYVSVSGSDDGMARMRTALGAALALQQEKNPVLVQVAVIDAAGPKLRAGMRGRAIGAEALLVADGVDAGGITYSAHYIDGAAGADGHYYGMRIDLPREDIAALAAGLSDPSPCRDPDAPIVRKKVSKDTQHHGTADAAPVAEAEIAKDKGGGMLDSILAAILGKGDHETAHEAVHDVAAPVFAEGPSEADLAAAEWLEKLRSGETEAPAAGH